MECIRTFLYICQSHIPAAIILFSFLIPEFNTMELVKKTKNVFSSRHACVYSTFLGDFLREWEGRSSFVFTMKLFRLFLFIFLSFHPIERLYPLICFFSKLLKCHPVWQLRIVKIWDNVPKEKEKKNKQQKISQPSQVFFKFFSFERYFFFV